MNRKAQLTVIFVVGVLILLVVLVSSQFTKEVAQVPRPIVVTPQLEISNFVESCMEQAAKEAVYYTAIQGGYYFAPVESTPFFNIEIPIYWSDRITLIPSLSEIEEEINFYIEEEIGNCFNNFEVFTSLGYDIDAAVFFDAAADVDAALAEGSFDDSDFDAFFLNESFDEADYGIEEDYEESGFFTALSEITDQSVDVQAHYPITVRKGDQSFVVEDFSVSVDLSIAKPYSLAELILFEQQKNPNELPIGYITDLAEEHRFTYEIIQIDDNVVIISLIFDQGIDEDLIYSFAQEYAWDSLVVPDDNDVTGFITSVENFTEESVIRELNEI